MSKFVLLIYGDAKRWGDVTAEEGQALTSDYMAYSQALVDAGAFLGGDPLQAADTAKVVSRGGVVTDGPFADVTEHLGGYYLVDLPSIEVACEWAAGLPGVERGLDRIEVRRDRVVPPDNPS